jgi:hypothetical protein
MDAKSLIDYFGGITKTARAMGVKPPSVHKWATTGEVPVGRQYPPEVLTAGQLRADGPAEARRGATV